MGQRRKHVNINATVVGSIATRENEIFNIIFSRSGNDAKSCWNAHGRQQKPLNRNAVS